MIEIRKILAPTDFSEHSATVLRYACGLAQRLGAELHLLHVLPDVVPASPDLMIAPSLPPEFYEQSEQQSRAALLGALDPAWGEPPAMRTAVRWGDAVAGVNGYAAEAEVDLIVLATHGRTGLSHALLGSVAESILRDAPCPVLTIRCK